MNERRLRELGGCSSLCSVSVREQHARPVHRVIHNGVSFARMADIDNFLLGTAEDGLTEAIGQWLAAHHRGDASNPFVYEHESGRNVVIPEAVDD